MPVNTYGLREVADLLFIDLTTNKPFLYMDYALTSTNEHSADTTYATGGKGNPRRLAFDGNRQSTLTISTQIIDFRIIALLAGADVEKGATNVFKREVLTAVAVAGEEEDITVDNAGTIEITLSETPVTGTVTVFPLSSDAVAGEEEDITVTGSDVTITAGTAGTQYVAYYQFESDSNAEKISFKAKNFPKYCRIVGDTLIKNETTGVNEPFQMVAHKASPQANFTLTMASEGDPTTLELVFDLFADRNADDEFISYVKYQ
jgi:hypothetical protein